DLVAQIGHLPRLQAVQLDILRITLGAGPSRTSAAPLSGQGVVGSIDLALEGSLRSRRILRGCGQLGQLGGGARGGGGLTACAGRSLTEGAEAARRLCIEPSLDVGL